jgi:hypothetical protein
MLPEDKPSPFAYGLAAVLLLALGTGWFMLHRASTPAAPDAATATPAAPPALPPLSGTATVEEVKQYFAMWGGYAVWEDDTAEFALWSPATRDYTHFFEVRRANGQFTFRRIAQLTRPLIDHGVRARTLMAFTETQSMRDAFYRQNPGFTPTKLSRDSNSAALPNLPPWPPEPFATARQPQQNGPATDTASNERALLAAFEAALTRAGQPPMHALADLVAILQLHRTAPLATNATSAEIDAAIARRKDAIEGILAASSAYLNSAQLQIFRTELNRELQTMEARLSQAPRG